MEVSRQWIRNEQHQRHGATYPLNSFLESSQHCEVALEVLLLLDGEMLLGLGETNLFTLKLPLPITQLLIFLHKLLMIISSGNHQLLYPYFNSKNKHMLDQVKVIFCIIKIFLISQLDIKNIFIPQISMFEKFKLYD